MERTTTETYRNQKTELVS